MPLVGGAKEATMQQGSLLYNGEPRMSTLYSYRRYTFSTSSSSDDLKPAVVTTRPSATVPQVLEVASKEARQVSSKAPQSASLSSSSPKEAAEAAQAMLTLTSPSKPLAEAILVNKALAEQVACLHRAFLAVTSWCISLAPMDSTLLHSALDLAHRAHDLSLPFHLPLYRSLVTAVAEHSKDDPADTILEVSLLAASALNIPLSSSFFSDALIALVRTCQLREAIVLRNSMRERHDIYAIDSKLAMEILQVLKENVEASVEDPSLPLDERDARELSKIFGTPLLHDVDGAEEEYAKRTLSDSIAAFVAREADAMADVIEDLELDTESEEDSDDSDGDWDDDLEEDDERALSDDFLRSLTSHGDNIRELTSSLEDLIRKSKSKRSQEIEVRIDMNAETGDIEKFVLTPKEETGSSDDEEIDDMAKEMIYIRDSSAWMLPDVTHQLSSYTMAKLCLIRRTTRSRFSGTWSTRKSTFRDRFYRVVNCIM